MRRLRPVTYNGRQNEAETYVGFIAEEVPVLVAMNDRKGIAAVQIAAVVAKVVQDQQITIEDQAQIIAGLKLLLTVLEEMVTKALQAN